MKYARREKKRDDRDFDQTSLRERGIQASNLSRDYTAHFFRWNFAKRFIKSTDRVLEVGCGPDLPLMKLLFRDMMQHAEAYVGVDLNKLPPSNNSRSTILGEFNFCRDWRRLEQAPFDVAINMEVIEHMKVEHGRQMLKGLFYHLRPGGTLLLSTPVYDGKRHAANHIHEYTVPELQKEIERVGFVVEKRYGTFMDVRQIKLGRQAMRDGTGLREAIAAVHERLSEYYDNAALACFFAPLFPDFARNNLWVLRKP